MAASVPVSEVTSTTAAATRRPRGWAAMTAAVLVLLAACSAPAQHAGTESSPAGKPGEWTEVPISVGKTATGIAITNDGDVYVGDIGRVYERTRAGYQMLESIPLEDLGRETGRVLLLEKGASQQKVVLDGVDTMGGIAVGADGAIYVARILAAGAGEPRGVELADSGHHS